MKPNDLPVISKTVENLLKMRQALLDRPDDRFDMGQWAQRDDCGTVCCLLGSYVEMYGDETGMYLDWVGELASALPISGELGSTTWSAAQLIGISHKDSGHLFLPHAYGSAPTKEKVLKRLDQMIAKYSK